ncbi:hypothetical protein RvY_11813-2 [Ramazzottius varieornatus]|uniref:Uncharacterized protein n=1 Tax=Ramazzottius varieornatus TaxID=947166 RepID=A0A1D1VHF0_RAMVA|nr:hypothetical protein RvY_11813-2 [Ramazzottius varieornatus]
MRNGSAVSVKPRCRTGEATGSHHFHFQTVWKTKCLYCSRNEKELPAMVTIHRQLKIGVYVEGARSLADLLPSWEAASDSNFSLISADVFTWAAPLSKNIQHVQTVNYVSAAVVPLETICRAFVLRVLVPGGFNLEQLEFLDPDDFALRKSRIAGDAWTIFRKQIEHCALFCHGKRRPPVILPYSPDMISLYAEKILSFVPRRAEDSLTLVSDTQSNEEIWIHIPLNGISLNVNDDAKNDPEPDLEDDHQNLAAFKAYKWWNSLKAAVSYSHHLGVALEITEDLPSVLTLYDLWRSEPVRAIVIPTRLFVSLIDGSPSLSPFHVLIVQSFILLWNVKVFLRPGGIISPVKIELLTPYTDYMRDLYHTSLVGKAEIPSAWLFPPSQPLRDHLTDSQYEEFELDKRKYADYEAAVDRYIRYRQSFEDVQETFVVAVVGCGYGPLIDVTINAALNCGTINGVSHGTINGVSHGTVSSPPYGI